MITSSQVERMTFEETYNLWNNARRLSLKGKNTQQAERTKALVEELWQARKESKSPEWFEWPNLNRRRSTSRHFFEELREIGVLRFYGYSVSTELSLTVEARRGILDEVFSTKIIPIFERDYLDRWSSPSSSHRLRQIAVTIANFIYLSDCRQDNKFDEANLKWRADMDYLHKRYYIGKFAFDWPEPDFMFAPFT